MQKQVYAGFFSVWLMYLLIGGYILWNYPKGEFELLFNQQHTPFLDGFFKYVTHLGDGLFYSLVMSVVACIKFEWLVWGLLAVALKAGIVHLFKHVFFTDFDRPLIFFQENNWPMHLVDGVQMNFYNSFPSGHTATAFCLAAFLLWIVQTKNPLVNILTGGGIGLVAVAVAFSRVYLLQHFVLDIYFGAFIGLFCGIGVPRACGLLPFFRHPFFQKSLLRIR